MKGVLACATKLFTELICLFALVFEFNDRNVTSLFVYEYTALFVLNTLRISFSLSCSPTVAKPLGNAALIHLALFAYPRSPNSNTMAGSEYFLIAFATFLAFLHSMSPTATNFQLANADVNAVVITLNPTVNNKSMKRTGKIVRFLRINFE